jgi:hypothetical protein
MIAYREAGDIEPPRELRIVIRNLADAYEDAERAVLDAAADLVATADALSDPAFTTLLHDHESSWQAWRRMNAARRWISKIETIQPRSVDPFTTHLRRLGSSLLQTRERAESMETLAELERQMAMITPSPFENEMREANPIAVKATGALHEELLEALMEQRRRWVVAWVRGNRDDEVVQRMAMLHRLTQTIADAADALRMEADAEAFNRWAAWEVGPTTLGRTMHQLPARLKLATGAALGEDDEELDRQLARLDADAPLARLMGRLNVHIGEAVRELPGGGASIVGQTVYPPTSEAWLAHRRADLAAICRCAMEQDVAQQLGDETLASDLAVYVNALADDMLSDADLRTDSVE